MHITIRLHDTSEFIVQHLRINREPILKKKDKIYLLRRNIKIIRLNNKLDYTKLGLYRVKKILRLINYKLNLPKKMKIYLSFYIFNSRTNKPRNASLNSFTRYRPIKPNAKK